MGFNLVNDLLVFSEASLALYEACAPGAHRFRMRCSGGGLPASWLLPSLGSLICEDLIPEEVSDAMSDAGVDGFTTLPVRDGQALIAHDTLISPHSFEYEDQALAALLSLGGLVILLSDETHAGLLIQESALAFQGGAPIRGGGIRMWSDVQPDPWGWSRESGAERSPESSPESPPESPIADALATFIPEFKGAFLFDGYLPRNTDRGIWNPSEEMTLPDISPLLEAWPAWRRS